MSFSDSIVCVTCMHLPTKMTFQASSLISNVTDNGGNIVSPRSVIRPVFASNSDENFLPPAGTHERASSRSTGSKKSRGERWTCTIAVAGYRTSRQCPFVSFSSRFGGRLNDI